MFDSVTVLAPAKINLGLKVFPRRSDGFHDIQSIFTTVGLWDTVKVSLSGNDGCCVVKCDQMNLSGDNTFTKAYKAFCVLTGIQKGVQVDLIKRIPAGGGLGGGSSNASSFIQSIDYLFSTHLSASEMMQIAGQVGSDVFFFTRALQDRDLFDPKFSCFTALVEGRGEVVNPISSRTDFSILLVFPEIQVSTKEAYVSVDEELDSNGERIRLLHQRVDLINQWEKPVSEWEFVNDFTAPIGRKYRVLAEALKDIKESGADFCDMSGSGSTLYGIYSNKDDALKACRELSVKWKCVLV